MLLLAGAAALLAAPPSTAASSALLAVWAAGGLPCCPAATGSAFLLVGLLLPRRQGHSADCESQAALAAQRASRPSSRRRAWRRAVCGCSAGRPLAVGSSGMASGSALLAAAVTLQAQAGQKSGGHAPHLLLPCLPSSAGSRVQQCRERASLGWALHTLRAHTAHFLV